MRSSPPPRRCPATCSRAASAAPPPRTRHGCAGVRISVASATTNLGPDRSAFDATQTAQLVVHGDGVRGGQRPADPSSRPGTRLPRDEPVEVIADRTAQPPTSARRRSSSRRSASVPTRLERRRYAAAASRGLPARRRKLASGRLDQVVAGKVDLIERREARVGAVAKADRDGPIQGDDGVGASSRASYRPTIAAQSVSAAGPRSRAARRSRPAAGRPGLARMRAGPIELRGRARSAPVPPARGPAPPSSAGRRRRRPGHRGARSAAGAARAAAPRRRRAAAP